SAPARTMPMARELGSDAVPLITKYMHDALRDFAGRDHARHNHFRLACAGLDFAEGYEGLSQSAFRANEWKLTCNSALGRHGKGARREGARPLIAQLVEQSTVNRAVASSSPAQGAKSRR